MLTKEHLQLLAQAAEKDASRHRKDAETTPGAAKALCVRLAAHSEGRAAAFREMAELL